MAQSKFISIIHSVVISLGLYSCQQQDNYEGPINDQTTIDDIPRVWESEIIYNEGRFYVSSGFNTMLKVYSKDSLIASVQIAKTQKTGMGFRIVGEIPEGLLPYKKNLLIPQSSPSQYFTVSTIDFKKSKPKRIPLTINENLGDFSAVREGKLIFSSFSTQNPKSLHLYIFDLEKDEISKIMDLDLNHPSKHSLVRIIGNEILLLHPYDLTLQTISFDGKLCSQKTIQEPEEYDLRFRETPHFEDPSKFFGLTTKQRLDITPNQVLDFYQKEDKIYLITKAYDRQDTSKLNTLIYLTKIDPERKTSTNLKTQCLPLRFDQMGNIFQLNSSGDKPVLQILPLDELQLLKH